MLRLPRLQVGMLGTFEETLDPSSFQPESRESRCFLDMGNFFFLHTILMGDQAMCGESWEAGTCHIV